MKPPAPRATRLRGHILAALGLTPSRIVERLPHPRPSRHAVENWRYSAKYAAERAVAAAVVAERGAEAVLADLAGAVREVTRRLDLCAPMKALAKPAPPITAAERAELEAEVAAARAELDARDGEGAAAELLRRTIVHEVPTGTVLGDVEPEIEGPIDVENGGPRELYRALLRLDLALENYLEVRA